MILVHPWDIQTLWQQWGISIHAGEAFQGRTNTSDVAQLALCQNNGDSVCVWNRETQSLSSTVSSLCTPPSRLLTSFIFSSFLSWVNSPSLSCFPVSSPHPSLFLSLHHLYFSYFRCFYRMYTAVPPPLSALHAFTLPPYTQCPSPTILPLYPHKNGYNSRGTFIKSKNKHVSVSVLLPWHVPQGCAALWMALSVRLVWGSVHTLATHTTEQHTHTLSKGHSKAVITSILQLCYYRYPPSSQSGLGPFLWVHSSENGAQKPSSNKVPSPIT